MSEGEIIEVPPYSIAPSANDLNTDRPVDEYEIPADEEEPAVEVIPPYEINYFKYIGGMSKGVLGMEVALMSEGGSVYERMEKTRKTASKLDEYLLDNDKLKELSPEDKLELYKLVNKSLMEDSSYLMRLHNRVSEIHKNVKPEPPEVPPELIKREQARLDMIYEALKRKVDKRIERKARGQDEAKAKP